jgi:hypothetical protein
MKQSIKYTIIIFAVLMSFTGCNRADFLSPSQPPVYPYTNLQSFEEAAIAPYSYLVDVNSGWADALGVSVEMSMDAGDLGAVAPTVPPPSIPWDIWRDRTFQSIEVVNGSASGGRQYVVFVSMYQMITACNDGLNVIDKAGNGEIFPGVTANNDTIRRIKAELLFNRARAYFYLVTQFCPPYNPDNPADPNNSLKLLPYKPVFTGNPVQLRNTQLGSSEEIDSLIISDLTTAKTLMPKSYNVDGRANYYGICAELCRVDFLVGKHLDAKAECDTILNSGLYPLQSDVMAPYDKAPGEAPASEVIMEYLPNLALGSGEWECTICSKTMPWGIINGGRGVDWNQCSWDMFYMSNYFMKETGWMVDPPNDYSVGPIAKIDKRYNNTYIRLEGYIPKPDTMDQVYYENHYQTQFPGIIWPQIWLDKYYRGAACDNTNIPLYRSAEFYLTRAAIECEQKIGDYGEADLNTVRNRAGLPSIHMADFSSLADWADQINIERIREMGDEMGDRLRYLMSLRLPIGLGDRPADGSQGAIVNPPYSTLYFKIPQDEVNVNAAYPKGFSE